LVPFAFSEIEPTPYKSRPGAPADFLMACVLLNGVWLGGFVPDLGAADEINLLCQPGFMGQTP
jgi:hypothetical protein